MPLVCQTGLTQKEGLPNYGSVGASCSVQLELDATLLQTDPDAFHLHVRTAYAACAQAVHDELARQRAGRQNGAPAHGAPHKESGSAHASRTGGQPQPEHGNGLGPGGGDQPATDRQLRYIEQLAGKVRGLDTERLDALAQQLCGNSVAAMSRTEASSLIEALQEIRRGEVDLDAVLSAATS